MDQDSKMDKKTTGAWLIHHTLKLQQVTNPMAFDRIWLAGKAGMLLSALSESDQTSSLSKEKVDAIARAAGISPLLELEAILTCLEQSQLINRSSSGDLSVLGLTTVSVLSHTADIFYAKRPNPRDIAVIDLAEQTSRVPMQSQFVSEYLGDIYQLSLSNTQELLSQVEQIGFVDYERVNEQQVLYFNGNLFRHENSHKTAVILDSLSAEENEKMKELENVLSKTACMPYEQVMKMIGHDLFQKLQAIGMYDVNSVSNERQNVHFITKPAAFSKFGNALVEDALDLAKAFVTSLTYGMTYSPFSRGRITMLPQLMGKLLQGGWVGPATAIGQDYKALELKRVVQLKPESNGMFSMRLLKKDVGQLAFQALVEGSVSEVSLPILPGAQITTYSGPEANREIIRRKQTPSSKREALDLLRTLRSGGDL